MNIFIAEQMKFLKSIALALMLFPVAALAQKSAGCKDSVPSKIRFGYPRDFGVFSNCEFSKISISIYNRWGVKMYESDSLYKGGVIIWNFVKAPPGEMYIYMLSYTFKGESEEHQHNDAVQVQE